MAPNKTIYFSYIESPTFSGQSAASDLIVSTLQNRGWNCIFLPLHSLRRSEKNPIKKYGMFILKQIETSCRLLALVFKQLPLLHVSLGQSLGSFIRVGLWYFPVRFLCKTTKVVISLNGSVFTSWKEGDLVLGIFMWFLQTADIVTVVGIKHKAKLLEFGLDEDVVRIVGNPTTLSVVSDSFVIEKHRVAQDTGSLNLLHLSLLIESKGFPEYLEAVKILAERRWPVRIKAVLCGPMSFTSYCTRFKNVNEKKEWITNMIDKINMVDNSDVCARWIQGANGEQKDGLFKETHVFVLPTYFPVEAQPLVLLEALSSGCAVITSRAGEIPSTLNDECAVLIDDLSADVVAEQINELVSNPEKRIRLALNGLALIKSSYTRDKYGDKWEAIFNELLKE